jgi:glycosyltransferase involved in cell wall biosynthesis
VRILVIVHQFLPRDSAGTEVYTYKLAKALQARGHELCVYHTHRDPDRPQHELTRGEHDGLPVRSAVHNHWFGDFRGVYKNERMEENLVRVLDEFRPDLVHVQHLHLHSIGYLDIIADRGIPIVFTLAEYLLLCLRSWLVKLDFSLCEGPSPQECARCAIVWPGPRNAVARKLHPRGSMERIRYGDPRLRPRYSLRRFLGKVRRRISSASEVRAVELRRQEHEAALARVDLFVAPSRFLMGKFVEHGLVAADRIVFSDYGFDHAPFEGCRPREGGRTGPLRIGYIGSIAEQKGVHLLVEACNGLPEDALECRIHGDLDAFPRYAEEIRGRHRHPGVRFLGRYDNVRIGEVLSGLDVLVVPSRWFENSPLSIHEAFMAGLPVITGNRGGMAELVEHGTSGLLFEIGDAGDLRRQIRRLLDEPELLGRLRAGIPEVKDIAQDAEETEERFRRLVDDSRAARAEGADAGLVRPSIEPADPPYNGARPDAR